jgi:hypothetical protein
VSYITALDELGIDYRLSGDEAVACCPAHDDRHASWSCNTVSGLHNCFSCGFKGSFPKVVQQIRGGTWQGAKAWGDFKRLEDMVSPPVQPPAPDLSWKYCEAALAMYKPPPQYKLDERRLTAEACAEYGILWDPTKESWILPIREPYTNKLWGWQEKHDGLGIVRNRPRSVAKSRTLFGFRAIEHGGRAVVVESPLDAARILAAGVRGGVSSYGVQISDEQLSLVRNSANAVVFAFDNDLAGLTVSKNLRNRVHHTFRHLNYTVAPSAKDPGDMTDEEVVAAVELSRVWCFVKFDLKEKCTVYWGRDGGKVGVAA